MRLLCAASIGGGRRGCNAVATALWVIKDGKTASAEYAGLNNKNVAVIARGPMAIRFRHEQTAPQLLAKRVGQALESQPRPQDDDRPAGKDRQDHRRA